MDVFSALRNRISASHFDSTYQLTEKNIDELLEAALQAPSAYNLQHTRFLAVTDAAAKMALQDIAYGQAKVKEAAVTFIVLADIEAHRKLPEIMAASVRVGIVEAGKAKKSIDAATQMYSTNPVLARDEAIRSASMASMSLMLAATAKGWASCPMIGFNNKKLLDIFRISERYLPVMLIAVGLAAENNPARKPRLSVDEILVRNAHPLHDHAFSP
jgi:nitroreductase